MSDQQKSSRPIVVVDQNADHLFLTQRKLTDAGVSNVILTFSDSNEAITGLKQLLQLQDPGALPCVVFTELRLPGIDGFGLIQWVRNQSGLGTVHVVPLTCSENLDDIQKAKSLGAYEFLVKFPADQILRDVITAASREA